MMGAMARSRGRCGSRARERAVARAAALALVLARGGCTSVDPPSTPARAERDEVALRVTTVGGDRGLSAARKLEVEGAIGETLSRYLVAGFLGDFPRERFVGAFEDFTPGAAGLGARDIDVLTASRVGEASEVTPRRLVARLFLLVRDGEVLGATAYVDVALEATMSEGETRQVSLDGRLMLEQQRGRWSVFGFDVANDDGAPLGGGAG